MNTQDPQPVLVTPDGQTRTLRDDELEEAGSQAWLVLDFREPRLRVVFQRRLHELELVLIHDTEAQRLFELFTRPGHEYDNGAVMHGASRQLRRDRFRSVTRQLEGFGLPEKALFTVYGSIVFFPQGNVVVLPRGYKHPSSVTEDGSPPHR